MGNDIPDLNLIGDCPPGGGQSQCAQAGLAALRDMGFDFVHLVAFGGQERTKYDKGSPRINDRRLLLVCGKTRINILRELAGGVHVAPSPSGCQPADYR